MLVAGSPRVHTEIYHNALTLPDYFTGRFEDKSRVPRIISALAHSAVSFHHLLRIAVLSLGTTVRKHLRYICETALWAGRGKSTLYLYRRFLAVSWTDTVQASLMIFALDPDAGMLLSA
ncbi:hypothetical protein KCP70_21685 [Salmonella enterica subsp. enterica]|nr:hypothetical protein KCP70_21685 [Salmonella enterica subsp. enterica]